MINNFIHEAKMFDEHGNNVYSLSRVTSLKSSRQREVHKRRRSVYGYQDCGGGIVAGG